MKLFSMNELKILNGNVILSEIITVKIFIDKTYLLIHVRTRKLEQTRNMLLGFLDQYAWEILN